MISYIIYFVITLALLIIVHEFGHFLIARYFGVKVLRFSIGFGKPIYTWRDRRGTEFVLAAIPLGGYVKMLDETTNTDAEINNLQVLSQQPIPHRIAIACAGPVFNLLFAVLAFWLMYMIGITNLIPVVGNIMPGSIAAQAGLPAGYEITAIDHKETRTWQKVQLTLIMNQGKAKPVSVTLKNFDTQQTIQRSLDLRRWKLEGKGIDPLTSLGIAPYITSNLVINEVLADSPAELSGLRVADKIVAANGNTIDSWQQFADFLRDNALTTVQIIVDRAGKAHTLELVPQRRLDKNGKPYGVLGIKVKQTAIPDTLLRTQQYNPVIAFGYAVKETLYLTFKTFNVIGKLVAGKLPIQQMSGPIGIAQGAKHSASVGLPYYLSFLAIISISLAVINILPVPMLDGGHVVYYIIEWVRGDPLSQEIRLLGFKMGLFVLVTLMIVAVYNDIIKMIA